MQTLVTRQQICVGVFVGLLSSGQLLAQPALSQPEIPRSRPDHEQPAADTPENLVESLIALIGEHYILEERIPSLEHTLRERLASGAYATVSDDPTALAWRLTEDLRAASSDLHFGVMPAAPSAPASTRAASNTPPPTSGLRRVEVLAGKIGYLDIAAFVDPEIAASAVDEAFEALAPTDALLIDVRASRGGHPGMVAYLASYLFAGEPFLLNRLEWRQRETMEFWTRDDLEAPRYVDRQVFVLISSSTPSAAEGFTYHLKHFERAVIVGETTAGAAHPIRTLPLGQGFTAAIPSGRAVSPRTGSNWEGVGVLPQVPVAAAQARDTAHRLALERLLAAAATPADRARLEKALATLPDAASRP